ncbi:MAG: DNA polymerase Y family protein, partial [Acidimicrobiia bacterium]|nr:DNA polymerase Y family protein [Acidimicrobiia bacterium]
TPLTPTNPVAPTTPVTPRRMVTVWCPDWSVTAAGFSADEPAAVMSANRVVSRTAAAGEEGVIVGQRQRQAQRRCPEIVLVDHDAARDAREFEPVVAGIAELSPRLDVVEPGWISLSARGPSRYFGGDRTLADLLVERVRAVGYTSSIGVADGRFAAGIAARLARRRGEPFVVEPGGSTDFCAGLPIGWLQILGEADPELVELFVRLGLRRLGDLAALPASDVLGRFGHPGAHAHRLASANDLRPPSSTDPAPERRLDQVLDDPIAQSSAVVFAAKQLADELAGSLGDDGRVCTRLVVLLETEHGERSERSWYRSAGMSAAAMVERVRWQLDAWVALPRGSGEEITGGIALIRLTPEEVRADEGVQLGLWGGQTDSDRRAVRAIARLGTMVSDGAVTVPSWHGGRLPADRYRWIPASTVDLDQPRRAVSPAATGSSPDGPWPGCLPSPSPATVLVEPQAIDVLDTDGGKVTVSGRGILSGAPTSFRLLHGDEASGWLPGRSRSIAGWAGPWPIDEHWWEPARHRRQARFQMVTDDGRGYLVVAEQRRWWVSAIYD